MSKLRGISGGLNSDSPRRHHSFVLIERNYTRTLFRVPAVYPSLRFRSLPSATNIGLQLLLTRTNPTCPGFGFF